MGNGGSKRPLSSRSYKIDDVFHHDKGTYGSDSNPEPSPTKTTKAELLRKFDFTKTDQKALSVSTDLLMETFWDIVEHIIVKKSFEYIDEILRVRAIFRWMTSFDVEAIEMEMLPPENSPIDYLMNIQNDFGDHCHLFYALCQIADIPCVIINGMTKNMLYVIGDDPDRELLDSRWNAVYIKGQWRFVDPYWAFSCIEEGDYDDKISIDAKAKIKRKGDGRPPRPVNEFFFLPDPGELIYTHYPDDPNWQLLDKPWSVQEWKNAPYIREHFHLMGLKTNAKYNSHISLIKVKYEPVTIGFDLPETRSHNFRFAHNLVLIKSEHSSEGKSLRQFVFFEHSGNKLSYTIRVPFSGTYRLDMYGKDTTSNKLYHLLCTYGIKCLREEEIEVKEFPDCPFLGWGPNPVALSSGVEPKPRMATIQSTRGEVDVSISMKKLRTVNHRLKSKGMSEAELSRFTTGRFEKGNYLIHVKVPFDGELALKVFGRLSSEPVDGVLTNLLTFLIDAKLHVEEEEAQPLPAIMGEHLGMQSSANEIGVNLPGMKNDNAKGVNSGNENKDNGKNGKKNTKEKDKQHDKGLDKDKTNANGDSDGDYNESGQNRNKDAENEDSVNDNNPGKSGKDDGGKDLGKQENSKKNMDEFVTAEEMASGKITAEGGIVKLKFDANPDVRLYPELCSTDELSSKLMVCEKYNDEDGNWIFELDMPVEGVYSFNLMGKNDENKTKPIYSGLIHSTGHPYPSMLTDSSEKKHAMIKHETIVTQEPLLVLPVTMDVRYLSTSLQSSTIPPEQLHKVARVVKRENELEVHLKFPGEFTLDIFKSESEEGLTTLARYYIVRKFNPEIDEDSWDNMDLNALFDEEENDMFNRPVTEARKVRFKDSNRKNTIQQNIKKAISQRDLNKLLSYLKVYDNSSKRGTSSSSDTDSLALEANKMVMFLQAQKYLDRACQSKTEGMLEDAVERAKQAGFSRTLKSKIVIATRLLGRIYKIENICKDVSGIDQKSLSELKKYQVPPNGVHQTLAAAFLLLGYGLDDVKNWRGCQSLLNKSGKESLTRKISQFDIRGVDEKVLVAVKRILDPYKAWQIRDVSKGASIVYLWVKGVIRVMEYKQGDVERCKSGKSVLSRRVAPRKAMLPEYSIEKNGTIIFESEEWDSEDEW